MKTITGIFSDPTLALEAGERVREVAGSRATVRLLVPGRSQSVVETSVLADDKRWGRVALYCAGLGLLGMIMFKLFGASWGMAALGLFWGITGGLFMGLWLTGELYPSRILTRAEARSRYESLAVEGRSVVVAVVPNDNHARAVRDTLLSIGADVRDGFLHEAPLSPATAPMSPTRPLPV